MKVPDTATPSININFSNTKSSVGLLSPHEVFGFSLSSAVSLNLLNLVQNFIIVRLAALFMDHAADDDVDGWPPGRFDDCRTESYNRRF